MDADLEKKLEMTLQVIVSHWFWNGRITSDILDHVNRQLADYCHISDVKIMEDDDDLNSIISVMEDGNEFIHLNMNLSMIGNSENIVHTARIKL